MTQRRGHSEWVKLIEEFEKSASSLEDFSAKLGVKPSSSSSGFTSFANRLLERPAFFPSTL